MSDNYEIQVKSSLLTGTSTDRTRTDTADASCTETFWAEVSVAAEASDVTLKLNLLTDPKILVVIGAKGISFKLDSTGTDAIRANPVAVVGDEDEGLGIDEILLSNSDTQAHTVTVIAAE
ncbi:MAG TPA: hypothetical protein EYP49_13080 [Anaerolineae bacterium]|nr:hypothetical protein [Anaerolineae bacterium]